MKGLVFIFLSWALFVPPADSLMLESPHEVSKNTPKSSGICITCHWVTTSSDQAKIPLWDPASANQKFISYSVAGLSIDISQRCLSCHDGLSSVDRFGNAFGSDSLNDNISAIRKGIHNNHPIAVRYNVKAGKLNNLNGNNTVKLFDDKVECASCHHPHLSAHKKHLRNGNLKSSLCLTCHDK